MSRIETEHLVLRTPTVDDLRGYLEYRNDPDALASQGMEPRSERDATKFLRLEAKLPMDADGWRMLAVERLEQPGIIGEVGVCVDTDSNKGDIGGG